jgi:hypothetical protein
MTSADPLSLATTGIGSLPHHNIDAALEFSFRHGIPFLPQIPMRNPWEYMIAQALEGIPGLEAESDGGVLLDLDVWHGRSRAFQARLDAAFAPGAGPDAFAGFEPSAAASSGWQPFLWELEERGVKLAKIQLAGPLTSQWALRLKDGSPADRHPELGTQIFRLVLARALAMCRRLQSGGIQPLFYLDEPGLYGFSAANPRHGMALQELRILIQALRKEGVWVGLHCCSDTDWNAVFGLGLGIVSLDAGHSLTKLLDHRAALDRFLADGGRMSLGVIPTGRALERPEPREHEAVFALLVETFRRHWPDRPDLVRGALGRAIYTPACGLALHSPGDCETILESLQGFRAACVRSLGIK